MCWYQVYTRHMVPSTPILGGGCVVGELALVFVFSISLARGGELKVFPGPISAEERFLF